MFGNFSSFTTPSPNSIVSLFYLIYFVLPPFEDNSLLFWVPGVLHQRSKVVFGICSVFK